MEYVYVGIDVDFDVAVSSTGGVHDNVDVMGVLLLYHCHHLNVFLVLLPSFRSYITKIPIQILILLILSI